MTTNRTALVGAHVVPITSEPLNDATVLIADGKIEAVGDSRLEIPADTEIVDVTGRWVLPGFVDAHTHIGTLEDGEGWAGDDHDEGTEPVTARLRALDAINPADIAFRDAVAGGVLSVGVNPGSCNPIGGQSVALRTFGRTVDDMVLRQPCGLKSALGENPKKAYGDQGKMPSTRMGIAAVIRQALARARDYDKHNTSESAVDLDLEVIARVLRGEIPWRQHVHRADDIATALRLADEFGYQLVIDHGTEAAGLADILAARQIPVVLGPLIVGRAKSELRHRSLRTAGLLAAAGVRISIATDHSVVPIQFLVHQATLAVKEGLDPVTALEALTINPAAVLGVDDRLGSLETGKDADLCVWSGDPLDVMQRVESAYIQGRRIYHYDHEKRVGQFDGHTWTP
ncbi:amidohydrolase [Streptomyces sp. RS2]|uniref:amidohydrolase n=1 Tax=Streptomyces sp. RS2 TaxID=1451205 RepID=UPI0021F8739E|nr:amidohydrolase [Streptomyces sp. RS2]MCW1100190.1 amidohydrolase [Streptomyces sp. RS2]